MTTISILKIAKLTLDIGTKTICSQLDLTINAHEIWAVLGQNGSGKTTLLHTLAGLKQNWEGEIFLQGASLACLTLAAIAQKRALLLQETQPVFPQTVWEYCAAGRYPYLTRSKKENAHDINIIHQALTCMDLLALETRCVTQLSGGEKRRLAIAALFAQTPQLLLLDEPTNHLDIRYQIHIMRQLEQLVKTKQAAAFMSLHDLNLAQQYCTHALLLLPNGETRHGNIKNMLTCENLEAVYQCAMKVITHDDIYYWTPVR